VLLGDMSLVGPRHEQPGYTHVLEQEIPYYRQRLSLRPGITGWAQVKCGYGATVQESRMKLEYDLFYIKHLSMVLDLVILFETGKVMLSGRGAK
jgi:lipopolysaccharide/colanic/teichoic acid biosynthesis glycosyltransferase